MVVRLVARSLHRDSVRDAILYWLQQWRDQGAGRPFAVRRVGIGTRAGGCQLRLSGEGTGLVSYWTAPGHRGEGVATRVLRLLATRRTT